MTKTTNYQLNQWEPTDRVLREDFNADNRKIDAALNQLKKQHSLELLYTYTAESSAESIVCPVDINWNDWKTVHVQCNALTNEDRTEVLVSLGNATIMKAWGNLKNAQRPYLGYAILFSWNNARRNISCFYTNGYTGTNWLTESLRYFDTEQQQFELSVYSGKLLAGTTLTVWGER